MKTSRTLIALAVAALLPMGAAVAGDKDKSGHTGPDFETVDVNRDGRISQAEAGADTTIVFTSADANGDGYLDKSEWRNRAKGSTRPAPQSAPEPAADPETPRQ
ncbi:MAG TPA: hypothetical protein VFS58_05920 [Steroidobacteraceae bacterium]|nr:hypothetical protein [Steroidobacteraceae bacterium]